MAELSGLRIFISYRQQDEANSRGRVLEISRDLASEIWLQSGSKPDLFVDRSNIEWGQAWKEVIESRLLYSAFLVPFLSPGYLGSEHCRSEFREFYGSAKRSESGKLVLPVLFASIAGPEFEADEIAKACNDIQWEDWTSDRHEDRNSSTCRKKIARMAERVIAAQLVLEREPPSDNSAAAANVDAAKLGGTEQNRADHDPQEGADHSMEDDDDNAPGMLELIDVAGHDLKSATDHLSKFSDAASAISEIFKEHTPELQSSKNLQRTIQIHEKMARQFAPFADEALSHAQAMSTQLLASDPGVRSLIGWARDIITKHDSPEGEKTAAIDLIRQMRESCGALKIMIATASTVRPQVKMLGGQTRHMRPQMKKLLTAFQYVIGAGSTIEGWLVRAQAIAL